MTARMASPSTEPSGVLRMQLEGKAAFVTGGGSGIGAAVARQLAAAGAKVAVSGRRPGPIEAVAEEIGGVAIAADATDSAAVRAAIADAEERVGSLDIVVANAGGLGNGSILETSDEDWTRSWHSNVTSAFLVVRESLPSLTRGGGSIVVVSSLAGVFAGPSVLGYTTGKHALIGLTRSIARDHGKDGVRANAVCPGWVRTPMADEEMDELAALAGCDREEAYAMATSEVPLRRPATPEEIASICVFLASPWSAAMTGAVVMADCGASVVDVPTLAFERHGS